MGTETETILHVCKAKIMTDKAPLDPIAARNRRSLAIALCLFGFVAIVFLVTMVRLQGHALNKPF